MQRLQRLRDTLHTAPVPHLRSDAEHALNELAQHGTALEAAIKPLIAQGNTVIKMAEEQSAKRKGQSGTSSRQLSRGARSIQLALEKVEGQKQAVEKAASQRQRRLEMVRFCAGLTIPSFLQVCSVLY